VPAILPERRERLSENCHPWRTRYWSRGRFCSPEFKHFLKKMKKIDNADIRFEHRIISMPMSSGLTFLDSLWGKG
jgi:hypothetical protein